MKSAYVMGVVQDYVYLSVKGYNTIKIFLKFKFTLEYWASGQEKLCKLQHFPLCYYVAIDKVLMTL